MTTATTTRTRKTDLVAEYLHYRETHARNRSPYNTPSTREEAGYHLRAVNPMASFAKMAPDDWAKVPYWAEVRHLVEESIK